jgi:hypothetical protein
MELKQIFHLGDTSNDAAVSGMLFFFSSKRKENNLDFFPFF